MISPQIYFQKNPCSGSDQLKKEIEEVKTQIEKAEREYDLDYYLG